MTTDTFYSSSAYAIYGKGDGRYGYNDAHSTSYGTQASPFLVGQLYYGGIYYVYRGFVEFDTSTIPDAAIISSVVFGMKISFDGSGTDFDVYINEQNFGTDDEVNYDGALSATSRFLCRNTSGISVDTWYDTGAMTNGYVSKTGITKYSIISSRDINANKPSGDEYIQTRYDYLRLVVTYSLPSSSLPIIWWS